MLDFGWAELLMIMAVAVLVIGPQEIPTVMRSLGRIVRRFQYIKHNITRQFDEFMGDDPYSAVNFEAHRGHGRTDGRGGRDLPDGHEDFDEASADEDIDLPASHREKLAKEAGDE
ncbi:MAG: twin-arginine translocase TatA/TatE family subunit [Alphaproteobacteria bacterium]|nr:twin-arginine translocase TatA/TatE family subunit [Alphaproteobacteria bacterium]